MRSLIASLDDPIKAAVLEIAGLAKEAGGRALIVGGAVRDLVLGGVVVKDVDFEVYGIDARRLEEIVGSRFEFHACGVSFGVLKLKGLDIDISLPRRESKRGEGHRAFLIDSDPFLSVPEAASRRDFTVNAMYYDPLVGELIDPYGGLDDLRSGILRHVSEKFSEDPLRVLRGMQFVARFGLKSAPETIEVCRRMDIEGLASERLYEEWSKLLRKGVRISAGLDFLRSTGWTVHFPGLSELAEDESRWQPTLDALDRFAAHRSGIDDEDLMVGFSVLCRQMCHPGEFLRRLTDETRFLEKVPIFAAASYQPPSMMVANADEGAVRRLALKVGRINLLERILRSAGEESAADWLAAQAKRAGVYEAPPEPILKGRHLIDLGYSPDRRFGSWLDQVFEAQLDGKVRNLTEALEYFRTRST